MSLNTFKYDTHYQMRIIAVALGSEPAMRNLMGIVKPEYFTSKMLSLAWQLIITYYTTENVRLSVDSLGVALNKALTKKNPGFTAEQVDELRKKLEGSDLSDANIVLREVQEFCKQAAFLTAMASSVDDVTKGNYDNLYLKMQEVFSQDFTQVHLGLDFFQDIMKRHLDGNKTSRLNVVPTGLDFDADWGGGLGGKELGLVFAPTGRGKSMMLLNIAYHAMAKGKNVLYVSCELSEEALADRMEKLVMRIQRNVQKFMPGDLVPVLAEMYQRTKSHLIIKEYGSRELTVPQLQAYIHTVQAQKEMKFDLLIVDYLGEMKMPKVEREDMAYRQVASELRALARRFEIPVWSAHQTSRSSHDKFLLNLGDVSDSFAMTYVADIAFTMSASPIEFAAGYQRLTIAKNRFGPTQVTKIVKFDGASQRFSSADFLEMESATKAKALELGQMIPEDGNRY